MLRTLIEIVVAGLLIALAWEKPFKERVSELPWIGDKIAPVSNHPQSSTLHPRPSPSASGAWMWDPKRKSILDRSSPTPRPQGER